jgi:tRNA 2-selenouridine synthase
MNLSLTDFFLLRRTLPVMDVRSEGEFQDGHIPGSFSIPVLNNEERKQVGTDYKRRGKEDAIRTGHRLVEPKLNEMVLNTRQLSPEGEILVYCWRGGLRSEKFCAFMEQEGMKTHRLHGGYKSYRHAAIETFNEKFPLIVIGGKTGCGKTEILEHLREAGEQVIDLEAMANHKGSAFGGLMKSGQPTTEQFQNELFEILRSIDRSRPVWIEDESISIGRVFVPEAFWKQKAAAPVIQIEMSAENRINRLVEEYGPADRSEFQSSMEKIAERLGGKEFKAASQLLQSGDLHGTIEILLTYYDKTYNYSLEKKNTQIIATHSWEGERNSTLIEKLISFSKSSMNNSFR